MPTVVITGIKIGSHDNSSSISSSSDGGGGSGTAAVEKIDEPIKNLLPKTLPMLVLVFFSSIDFLRGLII